MLDYKDKLSKYKKFKEKLQGYFQTNNQEWVSFQASHSGRVDLRIVSDRFENYTEAMEFITSSFEELSSGYRKGIVSYHTVDEAEMLGISKPEEKEKEPTWEKVVLNYINQEGQSFVERTERNSKVVSFYSYKGGAGRTLALTHTAYLLAKKGKNVLLIDLDIEAPSFFNVFENKLDIEHGLVDYLYERVFQSGKEEPTIKITDIFSEIQLNETLKGSIYAIPAGKLSPEYIFQLTQLQPTFISRKDYISSLIVELEQKLGIDIVLIDSRTGINEWGAFSLLDVADDIIFFAYPNNENIGGLKVVMELMKNSGCKSFTTVFSRIDPKGYELANSLFAELGLEMNQELISIPYETSIAIGHEFPIKEALEKYEVIAEFLLEDEREKRNREYLTPEKRSELLGILQEVSYVFPISLYEKIQPNKWFIIDNEIVLHKYIKEFLVRSVKGIQYLRTGKDGQRRQFSWPGKSLTDNEQVNQLTSIVDIFVDTDYTSLWYAYLLFILGSNEESNLNEWAIEFPKNLSVIDNILTNELNITDIFKSAISIEKYINFKDLIDPNMVDREKFIFPQNTRIILSDISWISSLGTQGAECLRGLVKCLNSLSQIRMLDVKILVSKETFIQYKEVFNEIKGNYLETIWNQGDIEGIAEGFVFKTYSQIKNDFIDMESLDSTSMKAMLLDLLWGIRTISGKYSKSMSTWFYEQLQKTGEVNPVRAIEILKKAVEIETHNEHSDSERLVSLESLKLAFEMDTAN